MKRTNEKATPVCINCGMASNLHILGFCMPGLQLTAKQRAAQLKKNKKLEAVQQTSKTTKTKRTSLRGGARRGEK
jgi:hypothetical protein